MPNNYQNDKKSGSAHSINESVKKCPEFKSSKSTCPDIVITTGKARNSTNSESRQKN